MKGITYPFEFATAQDLEGRRPELAILPIGSFEQHGPHLPMETDTLISCSISRRLQVQHSAFMLSPITISCSHEHSGFFATAWISPTTLISMIRDISESLEFHGIKKLCVVNAHGGNYILDHFAQMANMVENRVLLVPRPSLLERAIQDAGIEYSQRMDMHAGEYETSVLLADYPEVVRKERMHNHEAGNRHLLHLHGLRFYSESGVIGYPQVATAEKGHQVMASLVDILKPIINDFIAMDTEKKTSPQIAVAQAIVLDNKST